MSQIEVTILIVHVASTLFMTGLIWFVQVVHYPLKALVGPQHFIGYQSAHVERTGWVVILPMLVEAVSALWLVWNPPPSGHTVLLWVGLLVLVKVWAVTALYSVKGHQQLSAGFDAGAHRMLVSTNWMRTFGWSLRSMLVVYYAVTVLRGSGS